MLNRRSSPTLRHQAQQGMVLLVALIVLVLVTLGGLALMRSVDTATLVAGNLAFQQAATRASDRGVENAITMLAGKAVGGGTALNSDDPGAGYFATLTSANSPSGTQSWRAYWQASLAANAVEIDAGFGNRAQYVVHRMCAAAGAPSIAGCVASPGQATTTGNAEEAGQIQLQGNNNRVYYRITVRVEGPRRTESYVQAHVAM